MRSLIVAAIVTLAAAPAWAQYTTPQTTQSQSDTLKIWRGEDECARKAHLQYPDYTRESNLKRDRAMRTCLATGSLPPREDIAGPTDTQKR